MRKKRILVTGVGGFIASNLARRLLQEGYEVVGVDNFAYGRREQIPAGVDVRNLDIRSEDIGAAFAGVEVVFHLAAKNDLTSCQEDPVETVDVNVRGTANVFEAARRAGIRKVVLASSSALEEGEARLKGFYAISKQSGEKIAEGYRAAFGVSYVLLRYFNVYGPSQDYRRAHPPIMSLFMMKALRNEVPILYPSHEIDKRDFIYVDDINDFHLMCLTDDRVDNRIFRLGTGISISMGQVWKAIKEVSGSPLDPVVKPDPLGFIPTATLADISEAAKLGWKPKTALQNGLRLQFEYLREEFSKGNIK